MKRTLMILVCVFTTATLLRAQQSLPITRVLLYRNGMAYIVRSGQLDAPTTLTFHPDDMNDVLKSFAAWNPSNGSLYSVGYTAGIPSERLLERFPFDLTNTDIGLGGFLAQVKGADVTVDPNGKAVTGKLVAVQKMDRTMTQQPPTIDYRVTVLSKENSLQTMWLSDVRAVDFNDAELRGQLRSYLEALAVGRQDVTREVTVYPSSVPGPVRVAYLQQFPVWKTSYRLDLSNGDSPIQGWAQIDNPTGESWNDVDLSLLSGSPVSFVMGLYDPLYTTRSKVPVPGGLVAAPRRYESAIKTAEQVSALATMIPPDFVGETRLLLDSADREVGRGNGQVQITTRSGTNEAPIQASQTAFQQAETTSTEDLFEYRFPFHVQLASRQSALLPFLQKTLNTERLSIFNANSDRGNARLGVRLENTNVPLEPGPVTFFEEGRYAGEGVLDYVPRNEKRLISYGVDHDIQIAARYESQPQVTTRLTIQNGQAVLFRESTLTSTYEVRNKSEGNKTLILEHPRQDDRTLKDIEPWETTENYFRFRLELTPEQSREFPVQETLSRRTYIALRDLTRPQLVLFTGNETPASVREKLGVIVDTQEALAVQQADLQSIEDKIDALVEDQDRLRENLKALGETPEDQTLRKRYLAQLSRQEDEIDAARIRVDSLRESIGDERQRLEDLTSNLNWGK